MTTTLDKDTAFTAWEAIQAARKERNAKALEQSKIYDNPSMAQAYLLGHGLGYSAAEDVLLELLK